MTSLLKQIRNKEEELKAVKQELYELKNTVQDNVLLLNEEEEMVTVIRKITSFEEVVMTKKQFVALNKELKGYQGDAEGYCCRMEELGETMKDIWYETAASGIAPDQFTAFDDDITSYTDDMLHVSKPKWTDFDECDKGIKLFKKSYRQCLGYE